MARYFVLLLVLFCLPAQAVPIFAADEGGVRIVLTDEPCQLKTVSNLPLRATWEEKGKVYEGCWAPRPDMGVVVGYFSDLTAVALPIPMFKKVQGV